ncbi:MAG: hypothetical protein RIF41_08200, partial [Polyangiaceae bacterium]
MSDPGEPAAAPMSERSEVLAEGAFRAIATSAGASTSCAICLEEVPVEARICPECGERAVESSRAPFDSGVPSAGPNSMPGSAPGWEIGDGRGWLRT